MNKHDSERVAGMLEGLGSLPVETIEEADIVVFMTCCVREAADTRLYGQVASMKNIPLRDGTPLDKRYIAVGAASASATATSCLRRFPISMWFSALTIWALCRGFSDAPSSSTAAPPR